MQAIPLGLTNPSRARAGPFSWLHPLSPHAAPPFNESFKDVRRTVSVRTSHPFIPSQEPKGEIEAHGAPRFASVSSSSLPRRAVCIPSAQNSVRKISCNVCPHDASHSRLSAANEFRLQKFGHVRFEAEALTSVHPVCEQIGISSTVYIKLNVGTSFKVVPSVGGAETGLRWSSCVVF